VIPVRLQVVPIVHPVHTVIDQNVVMIVALQVIVQPVVRTEIVTRVHRHAQVQIVPIVHPVHTVTDQNVAMIVVRRVTAQRVVHMEIETHVQVLVRLRIAESAVTVRAIHDQVLIVEIVVHLPIVHAEKTHTVAIVHAQAMIAMPARLRVIANAVAVQIVPEVASPMIAKNVHAVALAKSA
jgi:hypothetical protein